MGSNLLKTNEYFNSVNDLKDRIQSAQLLAAVSLNRTMLKLNWEIGKSIFKKINKGQWGHQRVIFTKAKSYEKVPFYCGKTVENNWSRAILINQVESGLFDQIGQATTNFSKTLTKRQSELAKDTLKDSYKLDFLNLGEKILEWDIERQLVKHITSFLLELGTGFSFVGWQVGLKVDNQDFFIDLLFYHIKLKVYVVIELKAIEFKAVFAGKMNLYISTVDDQMRTESDNPTIGLLLCKSKSEIIAEYALRGTTQPIGIA